MRGRTTPAGLAVIGAIAGALVVADAAWAQEASRIASSRKISGEASLTAEVAYAVGDIRIHPASEGALYSVSLRYDDRVFDPELTYLPERRHLAVGIARKNERIPIDEPQGGDLDLGLPLGIPVQLQMELGAVRGAIELGGVTLEGLTFTTGASQLELTVSEENPGRMDRARIEAGAADLTLSGLGNLNARTLRIDAGVGRLHLDLQGGRLESFEVELTVGLGSVEIVVPRETGLRVEKGGLLIALEGEPLEKSGDGLVSTGYDTAARRIVLSLGGALGKVRIVRAGTAEGIGSGPGPAPIERAPRAPEGKR